MGSEFEHREGKTLDVDLHGLGSSQLMKRRVGEILLVSSLYDSFVLEEDGQLSDRILAEYVDLHLMYAPRVTRVSTPQKALDLMRYRRFDLVMTVVRDAEPGILEFGRAVKERHLDTPVVAFLYGGQNLIDELGSHERLAVDHAFRWFGDTRLLLAAIKLVEDRWNVDDDVRQGGVRTLLLVEDSLRGERSYLPKVYAELMTQTRDVMAEGLNYTDRQRRKRARPKILLARSFEEAKNLLDRYEGSMLAVISDARIPRAGKRDRSGGWALLERARSRRPDLPALIHSSRPSDRQQAEEMGCGFLDTGSSTWSQQLREFFFDQLGFGDFVFRAEGGEELGRARTVRELEEQVLIVPEESLRFHLEGDHFSTWLRARGEHAVAETVRAAARHQMEDVNEARAALALELRALRAEKQRGAVADFCRDAVDPMSPFVRLGSGSLGGKARGIAFMATLLERLELGKRFPGVRITVPQTLAIGTDEFTRFLETNELRELATADVDDGRIAEAFLAGSLGESLLEDLRSYLSVVGYPLAVRSSSLLEDSLFQPFAGIYDTYMIPNCHGSLEVRLAQLSTAIKLVYASTFFRASRAYVRSTAYRAEEERMGVIVQRLVANRHGDVCYPNFAGVAQSHNYYPIGKMRADEGIVSVALGLGKTVVEGGNVLRFSPSRPKVPPGFSSTREIRRNSQRTFFALDLSSPGVSIAAGGEGPLLSLGLTDADGHGTLAPVGSVYVRADDVLRDGEWVKGPPLITFTHILRAGRFPLAPILEELLSVGRTAMGHEVEVEFAVNLRPPDSEPHEFAVLQCRPMPEGGEQSVVTLESVEPRRLICSSTRCLGNGVIDDLRDVVFVTPQRWDGTRTPEIAREVGKLNEVLLQEGRRFILVGPGRWGTSDPTQGAPVSWDEISQADVIVEVGMEGFSVVPSQGSHFFHNIISFHIGYLTVDVASEADGFDWSSLEEAESITALQYVRHVRFAEPLEIRLDGRVGHGVILRPR